MLFGRLLASVNVFIYLVAFAAGAPCLPSHEVEALEQIANTLGKTDWNFSADPCSGEWGWATQNASNGFENRVNCTYPYSNNTICSVVSIVLKSQNLTGTLPPELVKFPYLQEIDLTRNYLNGTIPPEWGSLPLVDISLYGNRITGSIPKEFGKITTLKSLVLQFNQLSGAIPEELGNLSQIERMHLTSNNFTGELPGTLAKLKTLKEFRIGDNFFTGRIPSFIENWTNLEDLEIQASGLDGPIPSGIGLLTNMTQLIISDLNGTEGPFPPLSNMKNLDILVLRSCNINGTLPPYLPSMSISKTLDLSFNKLSGEIPSDSSGLSSTSYIYLTGNFLNGSVPDWMLQDLRNCKIDLSYNEFNSEPSNCRETDNVNLFGTSSKDNNSGRISCRCQQQWSSFHINCGGSEVAIVENTRYEADPNSAGPSKLFISGSNWAFSSTGHFLDDQRPTKSYIWTNTSRLSMNNSELYMNARLSPLSLTYYAFCLLNGKYTVKLHFAEIMFTDNQTFSSLGRRIFDVYIQGQRVLKDFNIEYAAGGVGKETIQPIPAEVTNGTLEIRFYWAGKGTTSLPYKGTYGPLISAISVNADSLPGNTSSISAGSIVGIVAGVAFVIFLMLGILWWKVYRQHNDDHDLKGLDLKTSSFTLRQIKAATNNFDAANKIGEGGFGPVYKGILSDGTLIAVKQLSSKSKQGNREFLNEIGMISALQHPHLVKLYGCCIEGNQLLLVYEYMENNSLARALFGTEECRLKLDWPTRHEICIGIAKGLCYLHEESRLKIVHRDIKATNVLLDKNLNPKISDFGLAKLDEEENTHISTRIAGTYGYMAPEYAMWGYLTDKADVYSFGIVILEVVSGRNATSYKRNEDSFNLLEWALALKEKGNLIELVDPRLESDFNEEEVMVMINVALLCTNTTAAVRPTMSSVVSMLEGKVEVQELVSCQSFSLYTPENEVQQGSQMDTGADTLIKGTSTSSEGPWTGSMSGSDLYPVNLSFLG